MSVPTLEEIVNSLSDMIIKIPDGLPSAVLHMIDDKGEMMAVFVTPGQDRMIAPSTRLLVARQDPALAVLAVEATAAITRPNTTDETDPDKQRLRRGEIRVSQLPPEKQQKMLMIYGEDRIGNEITRLWITKLPATPGWPRTYTPHESKVVAKLPSRLDSLYMFREMMLERGLNEYQARKLAREQATKELARLGMREQNLSDMTSFFPPHQPRQH